PQASGIEVLDLPGVYDLSEDSPEARIASSVLAGVSTGVATFPGTADDETVTGALRDVAGRISQIASILIKGQALGSSANDDTFGIVAQQIGKAQIGAVKFKFGKLTADAFAAAPTGPGATGLLSDFFLRDLGIVV
ncbi:MAG: hypothetical protein ABMA13_21155, partial [Chthoniobacteraceae bacterium]